MSKVVSYEVRGSIGLIQIDNPPVNALSVNKGVLQGLLDAIKSGDHDPRVSAFLMIGGGKIFPVARIYPSLENPKCQEWRHWPTYWHTWIRLPSPSWQLCQARQWVGDLSWH